MLAAYFSGHTKEPVNVATAAELEAVLDAATKAGTLQLVLLLVDDDPRKPSLYAGLSGVRGVLRHSSPGLPVSYSNNSGTPYELPEWGEVVYYLDRTDFTFPENAEIPAESTRKAAHQFLVTNGERPQCVDWTISEAP